MGMDLARKDFSTAPEYFIAGHTVRIATAVKEAGADLPAHTPVLLAAGKVTPITVTTTGSGETATTTVTTTGLYGITAESAKSGEDAIIYLTGEFFADALVLPEGAKATDVEIPLRNIGIFLK